MSHSYYVMGLGYHVLIFMTQNPKLSFLPERIGEIYRSCGRDV